MSNYFRCNQWWTAIILSGHGRLSCTYQKWRFYTLGVFLWVSCYNEWVSPCDACQSVILHLMSVKLVRVLILSDERRSFWGVTWPCIVYLAKVVIWHPMTHEGCYVTMYGCQITASVICDERGSFWAVTRPCILYLSIVVIWHPITHPVGVMLQCMGVKLLRA